MPREPFLPPGLQLGNRVCRCTHLALPLQPSRIGSASRLMSFINSTMSLTGFASVTRPELNLAVGYRLFPKKYRSFQDKVLNLYLELNTAFSDRASFNGKEVLGSGGHTRFPNPWLSSRLEPSLPFRGGFPDPGIPETERNSACIYCYGKLWDTGALLRMPRRSPRTSHPAPPSSTITPATRSRSTRWSGLGI